MEFYICIQISLKAVLQGPADEKTIILSNGFTGPVNGYTVPRRHTVSLYYDGLTFEGYAYANELLEIILHKSANLWMQYPTNFEDWSVLFIEGNFDHYSDVIMDAMMSRLFA